MRVRALKSFGGKLSMHKGQEKEITDKEVLKDLLACAYIEEVKVTKKGVKKNEAE